MANIILGVAFTVFLSCISMAAPLEVNLTEADQMRLTKELSKIDSAYIREEVDSSVPYSLIHKYYNFLDVRYGFSIGCTEQFTNFSTVGHNAKCSVVFDKELSAASAISVHDGFMPEFIVAEVKDNKLASILYKTIGNGVSPKVFFNTQEMLSFNHLTTGQKFNAFRLRIDCERNSNYTAFGCTVSAVK